jgi:hypothetical protein
MNNGSEMENLVSAEEAKLPRMQAFALTARVPRALSPLPVRALGGDAECDPRHLHE